MTDLVNPSAIPKMFPHADPKVIADLQANLNAKLIEAGCPSRENALMVLANIAEESCGLTVMEENLNYSAKRLHAVWPKRFPTVVAAQPYAMNPVRLANKVYGGRMGNTEPNDGWLFHGRGPWQRTGRTNYGQFDQQIGANGAVISSPNLVGRPSLILPDIIAFYQSAGLKHCTNMKAMVQAVNGGQTNFVDRNAYYARFKGIKTFMAADDDHALDADTEENLSASRAVDYFAEFCKC